MIRTNCKNCGGPFALNAATCDYCDTVRDEVKTVGRTATGTRIEAEIVLRQQANALNAQRQFGPPPKLNWNFILQSMIQAGAAFVTLRRF